jgi:hypothetical protein
VGESTGLALVALLIIVLVVAVLGPLTGPPASLHEPVPDTTFRSTLAVTTPVCGTWRISSDRTEYASAASANSEDELWVAGERLHHLKGQDWTSFPVPGGDSSPSGKESEIFGLSALSSEDVWAVGVGDTGLMDGTFREAFVHWNGTTWSWIEGPEPEKEHKNRYTGVVAVAEDDVWAVGSTDARPDRGGYASTDPLLAHWDGKEWSRIGDIQVPNNCCASLAGIGALSASDIWAVGYVFGEQRGVETLAMHWNGTVWTASPDRTAGQLRSVATVSSSDVWAVGEVGLNLLIRHWDGKEWRTIPAPAGFTSSQSDLYSIAASALDDVWAVGYARDETERPRPLLLHWDGERMRLVPGPSYEGLAEFRDVEATKGGAVWVVGTNIRWPGSGLKSNIIAARLDTIPCSAP